MKNITKIAVGMDILGGQEGVRQKRWTIIEMLCILREVLSRYTKIKKLALKDNHVIFTDYRLLPNIPLINRLKLLLVPTTIVL